MEFSFPSDTYSTKGIKETLSKSYRKRFKQEKKCITNKCFFNRVLNIIAILVCQNLVFKE